MNSLRLMAVGDIWLHTGSDRPPFEYIAEALNDHDVLFGNLETTLSEEGIRAKKHHVLRSPPEKASFLKEAGFDILSVANNHSIDMGAQGFCNTVNALVHNGMHFVGGRTPKYPSKHVIIEENGIKLGFLGYTAGRFTVPEEVSVHKMGEEEIIDDIRSLRDLCDHIVVSLHWGAECAFYPSPQQIDTAHRLIDAGATIILGHHPHTIQAIEEYRDGLIAYSLGLFQWDPYWPHGVSNESFILSIDVAKEGVRGYNVTPIFVDDDYVPYPAEGLKKEGILELIRQVSRPVAEGKVTNRFWFEETAETYLRMNLESYSLRIRQHGIRPLMECCVWLITPFCMRCYAGLIRRRMKRRSQKAELSTSGSEEV
jgi:hypothetical protein